MRRLLHERLFNTEIIIIVTIYNGNNSVFNSYECHNRLVSWSPLINQSESYIFGLLKLILNLLKEKNYHHNVIIFSLSYYILHS